MLRTWKTCGLTCLSVTLFLIAGEIAAQDGNTDKLKTGIEKQLDEMQKDLKKSFEAVQGDIRSIRNDIDTLKGQANDTLKNTNAIISLQENVRKLMLRVDVLQDSLKTLDDRVTAAAAARVARALDPQPLGTSSGTIRLQNRSGVPTTVVLGNTAYSLGAYDTRLVDRPAGLYSYEVYAEPWGQIQGLVTRNLTPGMMDTITITPSRLP